MYFFNGNVCIVIQILLLPMVEFSSVKTGPDQEQKYALSGLTHARTCIHKPISRASCKCIVSAFGTATFSPRNMSLITRLSRPPTTDCCHWLFAIPGSQLVPHVIRQTQKEVPSSDHVIVVGECLPRLSVEDNTWSWYFVFWALPSFLWNRNDIIPSDFRFY